MADKTMADKTMLVLGSLAGLIVLALPVSAAPLSAADEIAAQAAHVAAESPLVLVQQRKRSKRAISSGRSVQQTYGRRRSNVGKNTDIDFEILQPGSTSGVLRKVLPHKPRRFFPSGSGGGGGP